MNLQINISFCLLVIVITACTPDQGPKDLSNDSRYALFNGQSYCLAQDMAVLMLLHETRYPKLQMYSLRDKLTSYGNDRYFSVSLVPKGTTVTFKEVWTYDGPGNKEMHGWVWFLGEIDDGEKRKTLVDLSRLVGGHTTLTNFRPKLENQLISTCTN